VLTKAKERALKNNALKKNKGRYYITHSCFAGCGKARVCIKSETNQKSNFLL